MSQTHFTTPAGIDPPEMLHLRYVAIPSTSSCVRKCRFDNMLPQASLSFTIPSILDGIKLDCRVFHPNCLDSTAVNTPPWGRHVAIVAHPYAPLGGSYDDSIVDVIGGTLLHLGFMIATFNFRGASTSGARTSWTSKPERSDYMSIAGFMAYYAHYLDIPQCIFTDEANSPIILQAGYSYGAMIITKLPSLTTILSKFRSPVVPGSPVADIRLRAQHLAEQQNILFAIPASPRKSLGMRVGGDEDKPRRSHGPKRSSSIDREDRIRKGVNDLLARTKLVKRKQKQKAHGNAEATEHEVDCMQMVEDLPKFQGAYLLVSPPFGFATNLATMTIPNPFAILTNRFTKAGGQPTHNKGDLETEDIEAEQKLVHNPSLIIHGSQDGFLTPRKLREWTMKLQSCEFSMLRCREVLGAGHFWVEERVIYELCDAVSNFGIGLLGDRAKSLQLYEGG